MKRKTLEVEVNPKIIKWARESAGFQIEEIAKKLKISKENYQSLESGQKLPTFKQLELLAYYFKRPVAIFFLPEPPEEPSIASFFRILPKGEGEFSKELRLAIRKARYYQSISNELMKDLGIDPKAKIITATLRDDPIKIAREERRKIGISLKDQFKWKNAYEAFNTWRSAIELRNILVFQFKFPMKDVRGFSLTDKEPPVIALNSEDNILGRIFTLFHEYAHIILGISEIYVEEIIVDKNIEHWCDKFTSEFLLPQEAIEEDKDFQGLIKFITSEKLQNISKKYKVSKKAILVRLKTLDLIKPEEYEKQKASLEWPSFPQKSRFISPPQKCLQEKGKQFILTVLSAKEKGIITTQDAIEYLSIKLKHLDKVQELIMQWEKMDLCIYIIDTSSLIELKNRYPSDIFPTVWNKIEELYKKGRLIAPTEVKKEIKQGDDELNKWIKSREKMFVNPDENQNKKIKEVLENFPSLAHPQKPGPNADPWLISLSLTLKEKNEKQSQLFNNEYIIVTEETKTKRDKIPAIAQHYNIRCIKLLELFRKERWRF